MNLENSEFFMISSSRGVDTGGNRRDFMSGMSVGLEIHTDTARTEWHLAR